MQMNYSHSVLNAMILKIKNPFLIVPIFDKDDMNMSFPGNQKKVYLKLYCLKCSVAIPNGTKWNFYRALTDYWILYTRSKSELKISLFFINLLIYLS